MSQKTGRPPALWPCMAAERNHIFTCGKSVFRYFNYWEQFPQCTKIIADCWSHHVAGCPMVRLVSKLQLVRDKLQEWSKQGPNDLVRIIERLRVQVGVAQNIMDRGDLSASSCEIKLRLTLLMLIKMDEEQLRQKARMRWMRECDSNSKIFYAMAKGRQRRNHIRTIKDGQRALSDMDEIFASCTPYFKNLLTDNAGSGLLASNHFSLTVRKDPGSSPQGGCGKETPYLSIITMEILNRSMLAYMQLVDYVLSWAGKESTMAQESNFGDRWNGVIISNMISPTSWPLIQDTMNCTELFADQETYVHMFLDSMSILMCLPMLEDSQQDILEWVGCGSRPLARHHIWDILRDSSPTQQWRIAIWNVGAPPHAAWTTYLAVEGRLHVDARAQKHGLYLASRCYICKRTQEDINHVFFHGKEVKSLWELVIKKFRQICLKKDSRDVAALVRESIGCYIFGIACWSDAARATDEAWVLQQSLLAVQETDRNAGNIKVICYNGFLISRCCKCFRDDSLQQILRGIASRLCNNLVFIRDDPAPEVFHLLKRGATICKVVAYASHREIRYWFCPQLGIVTISYGRRYLISQTLAVQDEEANLFGLAVQNQFYKAMEACKIRGKKRAGPSAEAHREPSPTQSDAHTPRDDSASEPLYAQLGGGAQTPPRQTPPVDQQTVLLTMLQTLTSLVQTMVSNQRSNASPSGNTSTPVREKATAVSYQQFMAMQPPIFSGGCSYDKAKQWIEEIE
ncbi:hypothetical protein EJ110_NYTH46611, partial [Nymphaea thermarum]